MKYTKDDLEKMSDFEVNKALAEILGVLGEIPYGCQEFNLGDKAAYYDSMRDIYTCNEGYCDDWSAIMPLAIEHKVSLMFCNDIDGWMGIKNNLVGVSHYFRNTNPQRAIACCLILFLQEQQQ